MSDSHLIACLREKSFEANYIYPTVLQQRVHVTQPMRNSAPSRLQNIEEIYLVESYSSLCGSKTRSLTDLFVHDRNANCCGAPSRDQCLCRSFQPLTTRDVMPPPNGNSDDETIDSRQEEVPLAGGDEEAEVFQNDEGFEMSELTASLEADDKKEGTTSGKENLILQNDESAADGGRFSNPQQLIRSLSDSSVDGRPVTKVYRRKSVHFADTKGFDLEIKIPFCRELDESNTPPRLLEALEKVRAEIQGKSSPVSVPVPCCYDESISCFSLSPQFCQPFLHNNFQLRVGSQMVCLESVAMVPHTRSLTGVIRVMNIHFEKQVTVRYSTDRWRCHEDIPACYVASQHDSNQDQFSFHLVAPRSLSGGDKIEFAIRYRLPRSGQEFWDNNNGSNYVIICVEHSASPSDDGMLT